jgi:copper chaperone CopZ
MATVNLHIEGMHCGSCVRRVTQTVQSIPGTTAEEVRVGAARLQADSTKVDEILHALADAGFPATVDA